MATKTLVPLPERQYLELDGDWELYESLLEKLADRRLFVTYDRGSIEIMSPSHEHDRCGYLIARLIGELTLELGIPIHGGRSTTFKREDLKRGLEPDECFWVQNEARVRGRRNIDIAVDPPPDLAIEVEISRRLGAREAIYADLGVPEVWRHDGKRLRIQVLVAGKYRESPRSRALPMLPPAVVDRFLRLAGKTDDTSLLRAFREWVRETLLGPPRPRRGGRKR